MQLAAEIGRGVVAKKRPVSGSAVWLLQLTWTAIEPTGMIQPKGPLPSGGLRTRKPASACLSMVFSSLYWLMARSREQPAPSTCVTFQLLLMLFAVVLRSKRVSTCRSYVERSGVKEENNSLTNPLTPPLLRHSSISLKSLERAESTALRLVMEVVHRGRGACAPASCADIMKF